MKSGPIVIIEDDAEDKDILVQVLQDLDVTNEIVWLSSSQEAFAYLSSTCDQPFLIICDVNMPGTNGIELKRQIDADPELRKKSIPFIFYSSAVMQRTINTAYTEMTVQGFFQKKSNVEDIRENMRLVIDYWRACQHPNTI